MMKNAELQYRDSTAPMYSFMLDYNTNQLSWVRNFTAIYQYYSIQGLLPPTSTFGGYTMQNATGFRLYLDDYAVNTNSHTIYIGMEGIANTGFNLALSYKQTTNESEGRYCFSAAGVGACSWAEDDVPVGTATVINMSYKHGAHLVGVELVNHSEGAEVSNGNNDEFIDFYGNFYGDEVQGTHIYYTHDVTSNFQLRLGSMTQTRTGDRSGAAGAYTVDESFTSTYMNTRISF